MDLENKMDWNKNIPPNSIFVYNFPSEWMESDIKKNFMMFGTINSIIIDKDINVYAFVQYNEKESSQKAIDVMNGKDVNGHVLKVTSKKVTDECLDINSTKMDSQPKSQSNNENKKTTLFVFYLPPHWNDQDLFDVNILNHSKRKGKTVFIMNMPMRKFKSFGNLESATVAKKNDKTSKGYGFVVYTDPHSASLAISNMNKVEVYTGKRLKVLLKSNSNENNKKKIKPGCTIFVFYLPNDWSDKDLKRHFSHYGNILGATIKRETNGKSRGYGFINFENQRSAINAVAGMNGFNAGNKYLKVSIKKGEEQYLAPQYLNIDRMPNNVITKICPYNESYASPPPPPPPISCHGNDTGAFGNSDIYSIQSTMPNSRFNSRISTNEMHQTFINSQYGHFPYNFFKNSDQGHYMQRSYNKNYNNMGKT